MRAEPRGFSRETLSFLLAALALSLALYVHCAFAPLRLGPGVSVSTQAWPAPAAAAGLPLLRGEDSCFTGRRRSPFVPTKSVAAGPLRPDLPGGVVALPRPAPVEAVPPSRPLGEPAPANRPSAFVFAGTVLVDGRARALLRPKDGGEPIAVKRGDVIPEYGCTVTRIEPQAIHLLNAERQPLVVIDRR